MRHLGLRSRSAAFPFAVLFLSFTVGAACSSTDTDTSDEASSLGQCPDDGNPCTRDAKIRGRCVHTALNDGTPCPAGACSSGKCVATGGSGSPDAGTSSDSGSSAPDAGSTAPDSGSSASDASSSDAAATSDVWTPPPPSDSGTATPTSDRPTWPTPLVTLYVDGTNGNDSNDGSSTRPFQSIAAALDKARAGT